MIIFGYRGRWSRRRDQTGEFFCPQCGGDRQWVLAVLRRWFTLFFVPLFPVSKASVEAVECTTCHSRFHTEVLGQPTVSGLTAELQGAMRLAATAVVRSAGGLPNPVAVDAVRHQGLDSYDASALAHDVAQLDLASLPEHLTYLAGAVSLTGREQLLGTLADVARTGSGGAAGRRSNRSGAASASARRTSPACSTASRSRGRPTPLPLVATPGSPRAVPPLIPERLRGDATARLSSVPVVIRPLLTTVPRRRGPPTARRRQVPARRATTGANSSMLRPAIVM